MSPAGGYQGAGDIPTRGPAFGSVGPVGPVGPVDSERPPARIRHRNLDLLLDTEDMAVVLGELAQAKEAVERAARLVPVHHAELADPQR